MSRSSAENRNDYFQGPARSCDFARHAERHCPAWEQCLSCRKPVESGISEELLLERAAEDADEDRDDEGDDRAVTNRVVIARHLGRVRRGATIATRTAVRSIARVVLAVA